MDLDDRIYEEVVSLCEEGDERADDGDHEGALRKYQQAWELLPERKTEWEAATWILSAMGDAQFALQQFDAAAASFTEALKCPDALGNPFIHLRLGEACFELGDLQRAQDQLARAYMAEGPELFADEDPKYLNYLRTVLQPPPGEESI